MTARSDGARFVLTVPLRVDSDAEHVMLARLETARVAYNRILEAYRDAVQRMRESVEYQRIVGATNRAYLTGVLRSDDPRAQQRRMAAARDHASANPAILSFDSPRERSAAWSALRARFGLASASQAKDSPIYARLQELARAQALTYGPYSLGATIVYHVLRDRAYRAIERHLLGLGGLPRFRPRRQPFRTLCASSSAGMGDALRVDLETGILRWAGARGAAPVTGRLLLDRDDPYVRRALRCTPLYAGVAYSVVRGRRRWYAQITFAGEAPRKPRIVATLPSPATIVGVDLGTRHVAAVGPGRALLEDLAVEARTYRQRVAAKKRRAERAVARSLRALRAQHPECFERGPNGKWRFRRGKRLPLTGRCRRQRAVVAEAQRVEAVQRDREHGRLVNRILALGLTVRLEDLSYRAWQRSFGGSVRDFAPAAFIERLERRATAFGGALELIATRATRLSQLCICGALTSQRDELRKPIARRTHRCPACDREPVQRDLLSAFLARYTREGTSVDLHAARAAWAGAFGTLRDASTAYMAPTERGASRVNGDVATATASAGKRREARAARQSATPDDVPAAATLSERAGMPTAGRRASASVTATSRRGARHRQHGPPRAADAARAAPATQGGAHRSKSDRAGRGP